MSNYAKANKQVQWFANKYPGSTMRLTAQTMVLVLHTTEGTDWPSYSGGSVAPTYTGKPPLGGFNGGWRAHFPDEMSARALVNKSGGVETNTMNCVQIELVGTCDPVHSKKWGSMTAGKDYVFWPDATQAQLNWVADIVADLHRRHGLNLAAPRTFKGYPASYGASNGVRLTGAGWKKFTGICGHQHVPENVHGDPGSINATRIVSLAKAKVGAGGGGGSVTEPKKKPATRVSNAKREMKSASAKLAAAIKSGRGKQVELAKTALDDAIKRLPDR